MMMMVMMMMMMVMMMMMMVVMTMTEIVRMMTVAGGQKYTKSSFTNHRWFAFFRHSAVFSDLDDIFLYLIVVHVMANISIFNEC